MKHLGPVLGFVIIAAIVSLVIFSSKNFNNFSTQSPAQPQATKTQQTSPINNIRISTGAIPNIPFQLPSGFTIHVFASNLGNPRDLEFSPGGTLLVSNPNSNEVLALPDKNSDGVAENKRIVISGENHPHGLAFYNGKLFVADVDKVVRFNWDENSLTATKDKTLFSLPENNDHNNRTIIFDILGKIYISVGSTCNVCIEKSQLSGTILVSDGDDPKVFAKGLRNAPFMAFNPSTKELWATEMGRDYLGDNLPPDEINIIHNNLDYGFPFCYGTKIHDNNLDPSNARNCDNTISPIFEIPAHSAPLGLTFINSSQFLSSWQNDLLVSYHGSWNRSSPIGYKVVHLKVSGNSITSSEDFLTGFISSSATQSSEALGRPVDLIFDSFGNLYLSDDKAGAVYIIQKTP
ncbi:PQQ-dependent sugar dehydrogenase [Candidatus Daviesbacteria bacterium]|nr:PQQ-dependent sugar dehydrogenase [Candidatus Daviesbacteria bacterium]